MRKVGHIKHGSFLRNLVRKFTLISPTNLNIIHYYNIHGYTKRSIPTHNQVKRFLKKEKGLSKQIITTINASNAFEKMKEHSSLGSDMSSI